MGSIIIYIVLSKLICNDEYRELSTKYLSLILFGIDSYNVKVKKIIDLLIKGSELKGGVIECDNTYIIDIKSKGYRLTESYRHKGYKKYYFKTEKVKNQYKTFYLNKLEEIKDNTIVSNLLKMYDNIQIPSQDEILHEAKRLVKDGYRTKKDKLLKFRNKKSKDLDNIKLYSYVENSIDTFNYLTDEGYILPIIGGEWSGGRVADSFSLMPRWIRNLCKINGQSIKESDYSALHPNIAIKLFKGDTDYLTHNKVAESLNISLKTVKISHLSFFNQQVWQMQTNPVYQYYSMYEPDMLEAIIKDKHANGYKNITKQLFTTEVKIMTSVIKKLNEQNIYVGYIYDALFCSPTDFKIANEIMNQTIKEFGVKTIAKGDNKIEVELIKEAEIIIEPVTEEVNKPEFIIDKQDEEMLYMILMGIEDFKEFSPRAVNVFSKDKKKDFDYFNRNWHKYIVCANKYNLKLPA